VAEHDLPDEMRPLVEELNSLLQRVRQAFEAQQNFVADAAHELRSPLAALQLQLQLLRKATDSAERESAQAVWRKGSSAPGAWWSSCWHWPGRKPGRR
jgi:two-component system OmpR family sensor kinase